MKLSKITFQWLIYHALHSNAAGQTELNIIKEIEKALSEDTLEIEGYERVQWSRFDPNDPKTFPMRDENVLLYIELDDGSRKMMNARTFIMNKCHFLGLKGGFISEEKMDAITHWRPLPPPPGKEEA